MEQPTKQLGQAVKIIFSLNSYIFTVHFTLSALHHTTYNQHPQPNPTAGTRWFTSWTDMGSRPRLPSQTDCTHERQIVEWPSDAATKLICKRICSCVLPGHAGVAHGTAALIKCPMKSMDGAGLKSESWKVKNHTQRWKITLTKYFDTMLLLSETNLNPEIWL